MAIRNAKRSSSGYECELNHPVLGWIPFHAVPGDIISDKVIAENSAVLSALPAYIKPVAEIAAETNTAAKFALAAIDRESIRAMREWIAAQPTAPQLLKDKEAAAVIERSKLV